MNRLKLFILTLILPILASAQWSDADYLRIERSIAAPTFKKKEYKITKYGASPKATAQQNQTAINRAIAECSRKGGGKVVVPPGIYLTAAITLQSGVNLVVEKDATLLFAFEPDLYPIVPTRWEGLDCWNLQPCVYAYKAKDVAITGEGTIDGGGTNETWWKWCGAPKYGWKEGTISQRNGARARLMKYAEDGVDMDLRKFGPEDGLRPQLINFNQCENILIEDVTLLRSPFWVIHPLMCANVTVRGVKIDNDGPNGDGCDPESCDGVLIEKCTFNTGDDCIAVKSGRNNDGRVWDIPSQNIIIRDCDMQNGHGGVVIGSEITGGCRNLFAERCRMDSPELERVVRIKTNTCRGGVIENINARDITVGQCKEAVLKINLDYEHNELCGRGHEPTVRNVNLERITCRKSKYGVDIIALDTTVNVYDINVIDCSFDGVTDGNYRTGLVRDINFDKYYLNGALCPSSSIDDANLPIDRQRVVSRNNPKVTAPDPLSSLSVGNGHFAATVDVTGLQSYPEYYNASGVPLDAMSDWGWHSFANTSALKPEETRKTFNLHGRDSEYAVEYKKGGRPQEATSYFRVNPHRLNLGTVGLELTSSDGKVIPVEKLTDISQELKLWDGMIESTFKADGQPVEVSTAVMPKADCMFSRIVTPLLASGRAKVKFTFSYPTGKHADDANDWQRADKHQSRIVATTERSAIIERTLDATKYYAYIQWDGDAALTASGAHTFYLSTNDDIVSFAVEYTAEMPRPKETAYSYDQARKAVMKEWPRFWKKGGIADFGLCTDPRAKELERRVVLSQYLTQINCANSLPPQETGLTYNSWFGRPHLEMTWWHMLDFALWGRPEVVEQVLEWYNTVAYPEAKEIARRQNFKGIRWMKMTDPEAAEGPSNTGSFLIWQQPHYIYLAEEMYRADPSAETLKKYGRQVEETAEFMADYAMACAPDKGPIKLYGHTAMQESMSKDFSYNHPFEQAYWLYGLTTAQKWRERQGMERNPQYDEIIRRLAPLTPNAAGIYTAGEPIKPFAGKKGKAKGFDPYQTPEIAGKATIAEDEFLLKSRSDHPAVLGACGLLPDTTLYDKETMIKTLDWVMDHWNWPTTWGWDYGMTAMAAARLGQPETALKALLIDKGKNTYLVSGHNFQEPKRLRLYLPGNGALLDAVAMMLAGWDGSEGVNPGFPADGTWNVRWEGIKPMQ